MSSGKQPASRIVILSGPVGAGKTTVARDLVSSASGPVASIEGDTFWSFITKPAEAQSPAQGFRMIMRAMLAAARHYARDGYEVIVDFSIPPWFLDAVRALLKNQPFDYVVLRPSALICAARAAARREGTIVDYTPYVDLYAAFDGAERFTIENDASDPAGVAAQIRAGLAAGAFRIA